MPSSCPAAPRRRASLRVRRFLDWLVRLRASPQAIARGVAVGLMVNFTPTIGFQTLIAVAAATLLNASRPVAIASTWLTNPVTVAPIYAFTYYIGSFFWPGPAPAQVSHAIRAALQDLRALDALALRAQLDVMFDLGADVFVAMWIGGLIVGSITAAIAYPLTLRAVVKLRNRPARRRKRRRPV